MLAKITAKNQLTLPKSVTEPLGPVQYFDVQTRGGQIVLTPVRIQRGDALRAKLAELALSQKTLDAALAWAETQLGGVKTIETPKKAGRAKVAKPSSALTAGKSGSRKPAGKTVSAKVAAKKTEQTGARKTGTRKNAADVSAKTIETPPSRKKATTAGSAKPSSATAKSASTSASTAVMARKGAAKPSSSAAKRSQALAAVTAARGRTARGTSVSRRAA